MWIRFLQQIPTLSYTQKVACKKISAGLRENIVIYRSETTRLFWQASLPWKPHLNTEL